MITQHIHRIVGDNAPAITYTGAGASVVFWGLHVSDICMIVSTLATVCGVLLQIFIALHRIRRLEKGQDAQKVVTASLAKSARELDKKVDAVAEQKAVDSDPAA